MVQTGRPRAGRDGAEGRDGRDRRGLLGDLDGTSREAAADELDERLAGGLHGGGEVGAQVDARTLTRRQLTAADRPRGAWPRSCAVPVALDPVRGRSGYLP